MSEPLLLGLNLRAAYRIRLGEIRAVDGVDFEVPRGAVVGLAGESGCGKSTLVNVLLANVRPPLMLKSGKILLDGLELLGMAREEVRKKVWGVKVSYVPQSALNAINPTKRIIELVKDAIRQHKPATDEEIISLCKKRFEELNLPVDSVYKYPHELSGGMRQRVIIAISTLLNPRLLVVDEPTSALDVSTQKQVLRMMLDMKKDRIIDSILFVTHELPVLRQVATHVYVMYAGKIVEYGPADSIFFSPMHPYTKALMYSVMTPEPESRARGLVTIPGEPPSLLMPPQGCRFHPRCPYAMDVCRVREPKLLSMGEGRGVACFLHHSEAVN
ncbi:MAG: ABC transporter ATP-binding protein [Nitrososphaerota archaeon]|nr:ABC transporter ATP-binding protein [Candidatus Calditenuaceae archaeon]MDW8073422.1 ABC transporter ATP-binding protein [Nitrososphaerota archaeon]